MSVLAVLALTAWHLSDREADGQVLSFAVLSGALFGIVLQRSRFCFFCITRDFLEARDPRGLLGLVVALVVGTLGYHAVFGAFLPVPTPDRLPPDAHVGPVSWVLAAGALAFGAGMSLSGSCISAHLYRLGEGSLVAPVALAGTVIGFALGFGSWNTLYLSTIQAAPVVWLPGRLGYAGSLVLQLAVLGGLALWLLRYWRPVEPAETVPPLTAIFRKRWPTYVGGLIVGALSAVAYLRIGALGVTAELGSLARTAADALSLLPERLEGLDSFAGCATVIKSALVSKNGVFVTGLVGGSLAAALGAGDFRPALPSVRQVVLGLAGGVLMGWGAMVAIGCTIGTLLSGIMAGALSGWVFAIFCVGLLIVQAAKRRAA